MIRFLFARKLLFRILITVSIAGACPRLYSQELFVDDGELLIDAGGALVIRDGSLLSNVSLAGNGKVVMKGTNALSFSTINLNSHNSLPGEFTNSISSLELDNPGRVRLASHIRIERQLEFKTGNLSPGDFNTVFGPDALVKGAGNNKAILTDGTGICEYILKRDNRGFIFPFGISTGRPGTSQGTSRYTPLLLFADGGTTRAGASVRAKVVDSASANRPPRAEDFTNMHWQIEKRGINGGTLIAEGGYIPESAGGITGALNELQLLAITGLTGYKQARFTGLNPTACILSLIRIVVNCLA